MSFSIRTILCASAAGCALSLAYAAPAAAQDTSNSDKIKNTDDIIVTATKVNKAAPITSSLHTFEPQAIVSRSIIENSVPPTADYSTIVMLTPGASITPSSGNGIGLGDQKIALRGFKDGQYNITYDGIPFADSNDPTHHSTSYFPDGTFERIIVDRGPGSATDLGQASYGGNIHIISREATDKFFVEGQGVYGSWNTQLERLTVNSGKIAKLGDLKIIAVAEYKRTDGALTNQSGWWTNGFIKAELPIGSRAQFSVLSSYSQSLFHQSDAAGGATQLQTATLGFNYGGVSPAQAGTAPYSEWSSARTDWNWQNKTTDMEIARLQWDVSDKISFDNKAYTYFYKNFTISTENSTTPCTGSVANPATQCGGQSTIDVAGTGIGGNGGTAIAGDVAGYTKVNQYRMVGDIAQLDVKTSVGTIKAGLWYEHSTSHRYRYEYDFTKGAAAGDVSDYNFNLAGMANFYDYGVKTDASYNLETNGSYVPDYINYDEHTSWDQIQGFGEFEFKPLGNNTLTITPGIKVQNFTRKNESPIATQSSRIGEFTQESYKPTLPYLTINYMAKPNLSFYAQFAKGFIVPSLSLSLETKGGNNKAVPLDPAPTYTTNYQVGMVYAGERLNVDVDAYYIQASNSTAVDPTNSNNVVLNADPAVYKGIEGQVSYVVLKGLTAIANGTKMVSKDDSTGLWLPNAPNYTALLGAVYSDGPFKLSYLHKFTGKQFDSTAVNTTPAYSIGILAGSVTYGKFTAGVTISNLFNDRSATAGAYTPSGAAPSASTLYIYQAPRAIEGSLKVRF